MRHPTIGIVPAAGQATRLPGRTCAKELLSIGESSGPGGGRPKAVSEYLVEALVAADVQRICVVIAPEKHEILRFYGSGDRHGVEIAYLCQETPTGLPDAIDIAYPWTCDATVLMGMPDTIFRPSDAFARLRVIFDREHADLALGVFPAEEPERLGPVLFDATGRVSEVLDKPEAPPSNKVWGIACWGPTFTEFLHSDLPRRSRTGEVALGTVFQASVESGLRVRALSFDDGLYIDVGTMEGLSAARRVVGQPVGLQQLHP